MFGKVKEILIKELHLQNVEVTPGSRFREDLNAYSLDILTLLMTIEETYDITIPDEKLATFHTVGDVVSFLEQLQK